MKYFFLSVPVIVIIVSMNMGGVGALVSLFAVVPVIVSLVMKSKIAKYVLLFGGMYFFYMIGALAVLSVGCGNSHTYNVNCIDFPSALDAIFDFIFATFMLSGAILLPAALLMAFVSETFFRINAMSANR